MENCEIVDAGSVFFVQFFYLVNQSLGIRVKARHSMPTGQVRGESNSPSLSLLEGSKGGLWSGVAEWMAEKESGVDNCGALSGQEVSSDTVFHLPFEGRTYGFLGVSVS